MEFKKYRSIRVKFLESTSCNKYRFKLTDELFRQSLIVHCVLDIDSIIEEGIKELKKLGFNVIGYAENKNDYSVICDNADQNCVTLNGPYKESNK